MTYKKSKKKPASVGRRHLKLFSKSLEKLTNGILEATEEDRPVYIHERETMEGVKERYDTLKLCVISLGYNLECTERECDELREELYFRSEDDDDYDEYEDDQNPSGAD